MTPYSEIVQCLSCKHYESRAGRLMPGFCHIVLPPMLRVVIGSNMTTSDSDGCSLGTPKEADRD